MESPLIVDLQGDFAPGPPKPSGQKVQTARPRPDRMSKTELRGRLGASPEGLGHAMAEQAPRNPPLEPLESD